MVFEDGPGVEGLLAASGEVHHAEDDAVLDEGVGIPLEVEVRQRTDEEVLLPLYPKDQAGAPSRGGDRLPFRDPGDQDFRQVSRRDLHQVILQEAGEGKI
jgi:hypothetical protein